MRDDSNFNLSQRSSAAFSWAVWFCKQSGYLVIKFAFCFAFYTLQFKSNQVYHSSTPPIKPGLQEQLSEFRAASRSSRHEQEIQLRAARKLAEKDLDEEFRTQLYAWTPLETKCAAVNEMIDPFPDSFDKVFYHRAHAQDYEHYEAHGRANGWNCTRGQYIRDIINTEIVPVLPGNVLEIGPFINPLVRSESDKNKVKYFDIADWSTLESIAESHGYHPSPDPVVIDYVDSTGNLASITGLNNAAERPKFSMVVSANVIGIQRDLTRHLQQVGELLEEGGFYTMVVRFSNQKASQRIVSLRCSLITSLFLGPRQAL